MSYKTNDLKIISRATKGEIKPTKVNLPQIDTDVKSLLATNVYQGSSKTYSGDLTDLTYLSKQEQSTMYKNTVQNIKQLEEKSKQYIQDDEVFP